MIGKILIYTLRSLCVCILFSQGKPVSIPSLCYRGMVHLQIPDLVGMLLSHSDLARLWLLVRNNSSAFTIEKSIDSNFYIDSKFYNLDMTDYQKKH